MSQKELTDVKGVCCHASDIKGPAKRRSAAKRVHLHQCGNPQSIHSETKCLVFCTNSHGSTMTDVGFAVSFALVVKQTVRLRESSGNSWKVRVFQIWKRL